MKCSAPCPSGSGARSVAKATGRRPSPRNYGFPISICHHSRSFCHGARRLPPTPCVCGLYGVASFVHVLPGMRREIHERAFRLALRVARLRRDPPYARMVREVVLRQMIRSAASIGANLEEATAAQSRADFASKVAIATKEAREMQYWLRLGHEAGLLREEEWLTLGPEAREVAQVVSAIARSASRPPGSKLS